MMRAAFPIGLGILLRNPFISGLWIGGGLGLAVTNGLTRRWQATNHQTILVAYRAGIGGLLPRRPLYHRIVEQRLFRDAQTPSYASTAQTHVEEAVNEPDDNERLYQAWMQAAADLGITIEQGGWLPTEPPARYSALIRNFGGRNGCMIAPLDADPQGSLRTAADQEGYFLALLNPAAYDQYRRQMFIATLNDWQWFGPEPPPSWYTGAPWS